MESSLVDVIHCNSNKTQVNWDHPWNDYLMKYDLDICEQEKLVGYCKGLIERFYYNSKSGKCEEFIYGGCG